MRTLEKIPFDSFGQVFDHYLKPNRPVVLRKTFRNDRIFSWTPARLRSKIGNTVVKVHYASRGEYHLDQEKGGFVEEPRYMKFRDFVDQKLDSESYYLQQTSVTETFPELVDDIPYRELLDPDLINVMNLWIGGANTITPLHYDFANNFFIQCSGKKRVVLFEADQTDFLYPFGVQHNQYPHVSQVDIYKPDLETFPLFRHADPVEVILHPGDILFLPSTTWHQVESLTVSISVNIWFKQFDFQSAWPNMVRLIPKRYATLPYLHQITVPYRFSGFLEFCDHLLSQQYPLEACISYVALLEHLLRKKYDPKQKGLLRNDIRQAIVSQETLLGRDLYDDTERKKILFFLKSGKEMLEANAIHGTPEQTAAFCREIRTVIERLIGD